MDSQLTYTAPAASHRSENFFLNVQGPQIDGLFGGLTVREDGALKVPDYYKKLLPTILAYIRQDIGLVQGENATTRDWEALFNDIATAEARASESDRGCFEIFNRMVLKVGEHSDEIDPWINLIPNEYGLCIVKSAFALLLNRARAHSNKRQAIFGAFLNVRNIIGDASTRGIHFQTDANVYRHAGDLYEAIVDTIQELLMLIEAGKDRRWHLRSKKKSQLRDPQAILNGVNESAKALLLAVDNCRDATIKKTGENSHQTLGGVKFVSWKIVEIEDLVGKVQMGQMAQLSMLQEVQQRQQALLEMAQSRDEANLKLLQNLREQQKKDQLTITKLEWFISQQLMGRDPSSNTLPRAETSRAVISLEHLIKILCSSSAHQALSPRTNVDPNVFQLRNSDLETVLSTTTRFDLRAQSQAHSLLNQDRFFDWIHLNHPDMLLVDGSIQEAAGENLSPMSLLCANIGLTMAKLEPDSVIVHFYCGLHTDPNRDGWYGPGGMIRSLLIQLLMALVDRDSLDLEFLDRRSYVRGLERQDFPILCELFHDLVRQFDADTTIYCFLDGVSRYDVDFKGAFPMLKVALQHMQSLVRDDELRAKLKVLMTVPFRSSKRLREVTEDDFYLALSPQVSSSQRLSESSVSLSILRPSTPLMASNRSSEQQQTTDWGGDDYDDE